MTTMANVMSFPRICIPAQSEADLLLGVMSVATRALQDFCSKIRTLKRKQRAVLRINICHLCVGLNKRLRAATSSPSKHQTLCRHPRHHQW